MISLEKYMAMRQGDVAEDSLSESIYRTFSTPDGKVTLMWILDRCGFFSLAKGDIDPSLIAFAGDLMRAGNMGIAGDAGAFAAALLASYRRES